MAIDRGCQELFGPVYSKCYNEVREVRVARQEETYFFKTSLFTIHKVIIKTFIRDLPRARTLSLWGLNMSLGLTVEVNTREKARRS